MNKGQLREEGLDRIDRYLQDWNLFAQEVLGVYLDPEQAAVLTSVQNNKRTSVRSGTSRGKDFVAAVAAVCFFYLTPKWNEAGEMVENTKVAMTAPTERQVNDIMFAEVGRLFNRAKARDMGLPGKLSGYGIRTENKEWFLTGFKADDRNTEAWSGFHAANTMYVVTEASAMPDLVFNAIEGNLHGNSRILIVFNDNTGTGYASNTQKSNKWNRFRLDSLNAPNVLHRKDIIPGQVSWETINEQVKMWCTPINELDFQEVEGDFFWVNELGEKGRFRPSDVFRVKVRGLAPKVSNDVLVPYDWIEAANKRWTEESNRVKEIINPVYVGGNQEPEYLMQAYEVPFFGLDGIKRTSQKIVSVPNPNYSLIKRQEKKPHEKQVQLRLGVDVAGMGRDNSAFCHRYGNYVEKFDISHGGGDPETLMKVAGMVRHILVNQKSAAHEVLPSAFIDAVGEGAGVYSRLVEQKVPRVYSVKSSYAAEWGQGNRVQPLTDITGQYEFANIRAYLFWAVRDWLNPVNKTGAALPVDDELAEELSQTKWSFMSNGKVKIESKDDLKARIKRSPDKADALAMTFYPEKDYDAEEERRHRQAMRNLAAML